MKKLCLFLLCFCMMICCGCKANPQYSISTNLDGNVIQLVTIPYSVKELVDNDVNIDVATNLGNEIKTTVESYFLNKYQNFETRLALDNTLNEWDKIYLLSCMPKKENIKCNMNIFNSTQDANIKLKLTFKTAISYYYFNIALKYDDLIKELEKSDKENIRIDKGFFVTKKVNSGTSIFGPNTDLSESMTLAQYITNMCSEKLTSLGVSAEKIEQIVPKTYSYRYGTTSKRMHSDADNVEFSGGIYYHTWNIDVDNADKVISTWYTFANQNVWYALALASSILLVIILLLIFYFVEKHKKPKVEIIKPE